MLGLVPSQAENLTVNASAWWARDVRQLIKARKANNESGPCVAGGDALLWCLDWPENSQLNLRNLDPWFIEVCRRIRLTDAGGVISAQRSTSKATRVDAKMAKGVVGDPWAPVHKEGKSFTLTQRYNYKTLCGLLFSGDWQSPLLAQPRADETTDMLLIAEGIARGNSKTEGFHSRVVPIPSKVVSLFSSENAATLSKAQIEEIGKFDQALRNALSLVAAGGDRETQRKYFVHTNPARARFDHVADQLFFMHLWRRVEAATASDHESSAKAKAKTRFSSQSSGEGRSRTESRVARHALQGDPKTAGRSTSLAGVLRCDLERIPRTIREGECQCSSVKVLGQKPCSPRPS